MKNNEFKESAPVFTKRLNNRRVEINSTVRLSCQVHGLPVPSVLWYKDNCPVDITGINLKYEYKIYCVIDSIPINIIFII